MLQPVASVSFKAFREKSGANFSANQYRTINDIKNKLDKRITKNEYLVEPGLKEDTVILYTFENPKTEQGQMVSYTKKKFIGCYSQDNLFKTKDLGPFNDLDQKMTSLLMLIGFVVAALTVFNMITQKGSSSQFESDKASKEVIDTLNCVKQDSLKFILN